MGGATILSKAQEKELHRTLIPPVGRRERGSGGGKTGDLKAATTKESPSAADSNWMVLNRGFYVSESGARGGSPSVRYGGIPNIEK